MNETIKNLGNSTELNSSSKANNLETVKETKELKNLEALKAKRT